MKRILLLILSLLMLISCSALGEVLIPEGAVMVSETTEAAVKTTMFDIPDTGEQLMLTADAATGEYLSLYGMRIPSEDVPMPTDAAKALLSEVYPNARVASALEETLETGPVLRLNVFSEEFYGRIYFDAQGICTRDIIFAECVRDGRITQNGASSIMQLLRPEARITEIELDHDDGLVLYEGEARVNGVEYEFELDAYTGRLLQWDRD